MPEPTPLARVEVSLMAESGVRRNFVFHGSFQRCEELTKQLQQIIDGARSEPLPSRDQAQAAAEAEAASPAD